MKSIYTSILAIFLAFTSYSQTNIYVGDVINKIKIGPLTGNKNLAFGIKNIAEEAILDKEYNLVPKNDSTYKLNLEVVYFDVQQTNTGISVFHKIDNETILRIKGTLYLGNKKVKEYVATGNSSEISTSTMIIDEGGGFNQASARSALKKTIINLIEKLL
jgi:uncharacterized lipoprotein YajG